MAKYDMNKSKKLKFARFGGLSSVNQKGYRAEAASFHSPPASRGFYCFVWPYYEMFLLGGSWTKDPWVKGTKFTYIRDKEGKVVDEKHPQYEKLSSKEKYWSSPSKEWSIHQKNWPDYDDPEYDSKMKKFEEDWETNNKGTSKWVLVEKPSPKIFDYDGVLWHHLGDQLKPGSALATHGSWTKSSVYDYREALEKEKHFLGKNWMKMMYKDTKIIPPNPIRWSNKDHLEVFIEKI